MQAEELIEEQEAEGRAREIVLARVEVSVKEIEQRLMGLGQAVVGLGQSVVVSEVAEAEGAIAEVRKLQRRGETSGGVHEHNRLLQAVETARAAVEAAEGALVKSRAHATQVARVRDEYASR